MRTDIRGALVDGPEIRAGFIGCGSHAFRNIFPTFQFAPVKLVATCDLVLEKAQAFAAKFGAAAAYADHRRMLEKEKLDAVFIVTGYDPEGRPLYPKLAMDGLRVGCHVWIEKPPAASCAEIEAMQAASRAAGKHVMVGLKKMFYPANEKARELAASEDFGKTMLAMLQYPQGIPTAAELADYIGGRKQVPAATWFLDHLCHPVSLLLFLMGMPRTLFYERSASGSGMAMFTFESGAVASIAMTAGSSNNGGMERTVLVSDRGRHIVVENNIRVSYHRGPPGLAYGASPSFFAGTTGETTAVWEPEFSLGQLYNKGLFLLGYWGEVNEFARSILENRPPAKGTLDQAWQATHIFEAFAEGPGRTIPLKSHST